MRQLHEILWYLAEAATLPAAAALHPAVEQARAETERLAGAGRRTSCAPSTWAPTGRGSGRCCSR